MKKEKFNGEQKIVYSGSIKRCCCNASDKFGCFAVSFKHINSPSTAVKDNSDAKYKDIEEILDDDSVSDKLKVNW